MSKNLIFQKSLLISGIMCFDGCGNTIQSDLKDCIAQCIDAKILPSDARLIVDAEPSHLGVHELIISIESESVDFIPVNDFHSILSAKIKEAINYDILDIQEENEDKLDTKKNWIDILINVLSMGLVLTLSVIFSPSLLLTMSLTTLTFLSTLFTSREYLFAFFQNVRTKNFANMATTISLGWFLSMAHTLFHAINMPLVTSFSMIFMNFIMPTLLIACINSMDEIKRLILEKTKKNQLKGVKTLFPQMSETYRCYRLSESSSKRLTYAIKWILQSSSSSEKSFPLSQSMVKHLHNLLDNQEGSEEKRQFLSEGLVIDVNAGECFPVDCILIKGNTIIDASLLTGEPHQSKSLWHSIPGGAINLGQKVTVYAMRNSYNSTVNTLLFRSNRAKEISYSKEEMPRFAYFYTALIVVGLIGAILTPFALGIATIPLVMQNIIGILFSVCPCTIAIAHQLPRLISLHHRSRKGIQLRDDSLLASQTEMHTVIFDKTGTLTTGNSVIESSDIPVASPLWQRIYLLEKAYGRGHPLAKAIQQHYETVLNHHVLFDEITDYTMDTKQRGFSARVQGKKIHIGNCDYLHDNGIECPELSISKIEQGFSAVCVAEDGVYKGIIYVKHEIRKGALEALAQLKKEGKKIIMLTGDNLLSAQGFNKQMTSIFDEADIHAAQTPQDKEEFVRKILSTKGVNPNGVWFVGDGLNDAPCCRMVSEKGGMSCAMSLNDKSAFFTDVALNESFDYLFKHNELNQLLQQNITQNKGILIYSTVAFFAFIISFSIAGIAVSPLLPMTIMLATTLLVLFNAYRAQLNIDTALDKECNWYKKQLSSNVSIGLLFSASTLLIVATLIATIATGGLTLPIIAFSAGVTVAFSSICTLFSIALLSIFTGLLSAAFLSEQSLQTSDKNSSLKVTRTTEDFKSEQIDLISMKNTNDFRARASMTELNNHEMGFFVRSRSTSNDTDVIDKRTDVDDMSICDLQQI